VQEKVSLSSFEIVKCIGTGGFSKVFLCRFMETGIFYAMKVIDKEFIVKNKKKKIVMNERNIMAELSHPFVIKMKFAF
jgi:serine/threonine protein kinase